MAKTIIIVRHGRKDGEMIAADQIQEIVKNGIPAIDNNLPEESFIYVHPGSALIRTRQTIEAWQKHFIAKHGEEGIWVLDEDLPFAPSYRFGNDVMFARFGPLKTGFKETGNWLETLQKYAPDFLKEIKEGLMKAITEVFAWPEDGETVVMAGHTPMIEIMAQGIDPDADVSPLAELEGFVFEQDEEGGPITVRRVK
jgi:phosphohistidine phosphatase SixA